MSLGISIEIGTKQRRGVDLKKAVSHKYTVKNVFVCENGLTRLHLPRSLSRGLTGFLYCLAVLFLPIAAYILGFFCLS